MTIRESKTPYEVADSERARIMQEDAKVSRELQVRQELGELWAQLEKAEALTNQLIERLEHVLRVRDDGGPADEKALIALVPLADQIREHRLLFVQGVVAKLDYILSYLEI